MDRPVSPGDGRQRHHGRCLRRRECARQFGGETRQIRAGYANQEYYTRWVVEAFARWKRRQADWGRTLFFETGQIALAQEWTKSLKETQTVLDRVGVETHVLTHADVVRRFPQVNAEGINLGVYTPGTGVLKAREGCQAVADAFQRDGGASPSRGRRSAGRLAGNCRT